MAIKVIRKLRLLFDVTFTRPDSTPVQDGDVVTYVQADDQFYVAAPTGGGGGGAPTGANYLVGTAQAGLSAEIVVGATPGGELGGSWASPTVDAVHSGSSHAQVQAAAEATAAAALAASEAGQVRDGDAAGGVLGGTYPNPGFAVDMATQAELDAVSGAVSALDAAAVKDGDAAGGVLASTYPNPTFAVDMATQAELDAHTGDVSGAHDASAISIADAGNYFTGTDVEVALQELGGAGGASLLVPITDSFPYADGNMPFPPWVPMAETGDQASISGNKVRGFAAAHTVGHIHSNEMYPSDQYSEIQVTSDALASGDWIGPVVRSRQEPAATLGYHCYLGIYFNNGGTYQLILYRRTDLTTFVQLGSTYTLAGALSVGDKLRLTATGPALAFSVNGVDRVTATDANYVDGYPGFMITGAAYLDGFETIGVKALSHGYRHFDQHPEALSIEGLDGISTELANHLADATDAHDASAISIADAGGHFTGTDVEAALQELGVLGNYREFWDAGIGNKELPGTYSVVQGTWSWFSDGSQGIKTYYLNNGTGTAQNDEITIPVVLAAGTWRLDIFLVKGSNCGIITALIDGSSVGTIDTYAGTTTYSLVESITGITVASTGVKTLGLRMATKNASSSNYRLNITCLALTRTGP